MMSESVEKLAEALAKAQGDFPSIEKNKQAKFPTKSGAMISYQYADLPDILKAIRKPLAANGLSITQVFNEGIITTILLHSSGQWIKSSLPIVRDATAKMQDFGAQITYLRRYVITAILGVCADEDNDGDSSQRETCIEAVQKGAPACAPKLPMNEQIKREQLSAIRSMLKAHPQGDRFHAAILEEFSLESLEKGDSPILGKIIMKLQRNGNV